MHEDRRRIVPVLSNSHRCGVAPRTYRYSMCQNDEAPPPSWRAGGKRAEALEVLLSEAVELCDFDGELADTLSSQLGLPRRRESTPLPDTVQSDRSMTALRMLVDAATKSCDSDFPGILTCIRLLVAHVDLKSRSNITLH
jgi:hypothetical protein